MNIKKSESLRQIYNFFLYGYRIIIEPLILIFFIFIFASIGKKD